MANITLIYRYSESCYIVVEMLSTFSQQNSIPRFDSFVNSQMWLILAKSIFWLTVATSFRLFGLVKPKSYFLS